jgi:DNA polymerase-3 subunit alpha
MNFNPIYWNTACLIVNSGATDEEAGGQTDYGKIAKAIGDIIGAGIKVSLVNINKSEFGFAPDVENNQILFGLKGMLNVGDDIITAIIENRPYSSIKDFYYKVKPSKQTMISLIKGGAFDEMEDRKFAMAWYIWETCEKKSRITLQNMPSLVKYGLLPEDTEERIMARRVYEFNRYLKAITKADPYAYKDMYSLDTRAISFLYEIDCEDLTITDNVSHFIKVKVWDKVYQKYMDVFREWIAKDKNEILTQLNTIIFKEDWDKYATGNVSAWEMEALCFYYHEHELAHLNQYRYGFADFNKLPEEPVIERTFTKGGKDIKIFKLDKICGTCIAKNKVKSTVTLLTTTGVVNVKFRKEYFSMFDKQISVRGEDGVKHVVEKSWFNRGNMIVVNGMRSGDDFISKKYASTSGHQLYRIERVNDDGTLVLKDHRYQGGIEEEDV